MPGYLMHEGVIVTCAHLGPATPTQASARVMVSGQAVITQISTYGVTGCQLPIVTTGAPPCVTGSWIAAARQVFADGAPVVLTDSQSSCQPNQTPLILGVTQLFVKGS
ncbi:hypothetical protein [Paraburkholderia sp. HP33-1]|uniref:hypothetical protein n=1 Tax=Paraburkholderia sp. HP33-1 TaxID=2883243 RepID=UPI001F37A23A|nr:hypothetical protein [Paraburkholderia sp. HP33-1]